MRSTDLAPASHLSLECYLEVVVARDQSACRLLRIDGERGNQYWLDHKCPKLYPIHSVTIGNVERKVQLYLQLYEFETAAMYQQPVSLDFDSLHIFPTPRGNSLKTPSRSVSAVRPQHHNDEHSVSYQATVLGSDSFFTFVKQVLICLFLIVIRLIRCHCGQMSQRQCSRGSMYVELWVTASADLYSLT